MDISDTISSLFGMCSGALLVWKIQGLMNISWIVIFLCFLISILFGIKNENLSIFL